MADSAFQIQYRQEFIAQFEQGQSWLRNVCTTEAVIKRNQAMFLVAGSGGATAVTRGLNGNIPPRVDSLTQVPATLIEWYDKPQRTEFNIFASQGDGRRIMQMSTVKVMNRKIDQDILGMLSAASNTLGAAQTMTLALATRALAHLDLQDVDTTEEDNMFSAGGGFFLRCGAENWSRNTEIRATVMVGIRSDLSFGRSNRGFGFRVATNLR
jgi:hypothetical protein